MQLTIIVEDNGVYVNREIRMPLDLSNCGIPSDIHALQWNGTVGWLEFVDNPDGTKPQNETISVLPSWANACVDEWNKWTPMPLTTAKPAADQPSTSGTKTV